MKRNLLMVGDKSSAGGTVLAILSKMPFTNKGKANGCINASMVVTAICTLAYGEA